MDAQELFAANKGLVAAVMKRFQGRILPPDANLDDMRQVAFIGLWKACASGAFDPTRGVKFSTFAVSCISHQVLTWFGQVTKQSRGGNRGGDISLNRLLNETGEVRHNVEPSSREPPPGQKLLDGEHRAAVGRLIKAAKRCVSVKVWRMLLRRYIDGVSWVGIAEEFGGRSSRSTRASVTDHLEVFRKNHPRVVANAKAYLHCGSDK